MERLKTGLWIVLLIVGMFMIGDGVANALSIPYGGTTADRILK